VEEVLAEALRRLKPVQDHFQAEEELEFSHMVMVDLAVVITVVSEEVNRKNLIFKTKFQFLSMQDMADTVAAVALEDLKESPAQVVTVVEARTENNPRNSPLESQL
jgi:hypothetical protein